jgi:ABC-type branched-subunit amino acid transport system substrate-binding protein
MKRTLSLLTLVVLLGAMLAACGGAPAAPPAAENPTAAPAATEAATAAPAATEAPTAAATEAPTAAATAAATAEAAATAPAESASGTTLDFITETAAGLTPEIVTALGTVKIATQSPLSGPQSVLGTSIQRAVELTVEQLNSDLASSNLTMEVAPFDDQAKPEVGSANAKNIVSDPDILCVVGHLNSGVALASLPDYQSAGLAMVSPANTNPNITEGGYGVAFRVVGRDDVQGAVGEQFARENLGAKSVYIIHDTTAYGQGVAEFFRQNAEKNNIEVLGFEGTEEQSDFSAILTPIQAANPDLIYFGGLYPQAGPLFRQARDRGITAQFLGPDGLDSNQLAELAGDAIEGMHYTSVAAPISQFPLAAQFDTDFQAKFNEGPQPFAAQAYDSAQICAAGIIKAAVDAGGKPTREQVTEAIKALPSVQGITGNIKFNPKGDVEVATYFVLKANADPTKWGENELVDKLEIAPPQ